MTISVRSLLPVSAKTKGGTESITYHNTDYILHYNL